MHSLDTTTDPDSFWGELRQIWFFIIKLKLDPRVFGILREVLDPKISALFPEHVAEMMQFSNQTMYRVLDTGRRLGAIRTDLPLDLLVQMFQGMMMGVSAWLLEQMHRGMVMDAERLTEFLHELIIRTMEPGAGLSPAALTFFEAFHKLEEYPEDPARPSGCGVWLQVPKPGTLPKGD